MEYSVVTIDMATSKQDFLLRLVTESKKKIQTVFVDVQSLPSFLDGDVSFSVFVSSLRTFPKEIRWTSDDTSIYTFLSSHPEVEAISYSEFKTEIGEVKSVQRGSLTDTTHGQLALEGEISQSTEFKHTPHKIDATAHTTVEQLPVTNLATQASEDNSPDNTTESYSQLQQEYEEFVSSQSFNTSQKLYTEQGLQTQSTDADLYEDRLQNLDSMIERLEKTKVDLSRKGKYPLKLQDIFSDPQKMDWISRFMPLTSVRSSLLFVIIIVIISFAILLRLYPL